MQNMNAEEVRKITTLCLSMIIKHSNRRIALLEINHSESSAITSNISNSCGVFQASSSL